MASPGRSPERCRPSSSPYIDEQVASRFRGEECARLALKSRFRTRTATGAGRGEAGFADGSDEMIRLDGISKRYPDGTVAVAHLDLVVPRGELVCLLGPSGCGKTTTMRMVNRLIEPTTGRVVLDGRD